MKYINCIVPEDGHRNSDGYVRVLDKPRKEGGRLVMLHRLEWEKVNSPIPEGYEINHLCKNRECCNVNHMEVISRSEHKSKDNSQRYKVREDVIVAFIMKNPDMYQREVAHIFGMSQNGISKIKNRRIKEI